MKVLVAGGDGYVGSRLVPRLLEEGREVVVYDWYLFGQEPLGPVRGNPRLKECDGDIRDLRLFKTAVTGCDAVIHLACISNDPSVNLDPVLSRSINCDFFQPMVRLCKEAGVQRFVFASSAGVYGVNPDSMTEDKPNRPFTDYNRYKSYCESVLWEEQTEGFTVVAIRPATICGYAPRMRLDLVVNILTDQALNKGRITVLGGSQMRPNLHIEDMVDLYLLLLEAPKEKIAGQAFNAGRQNHSVLDLAKMVREIVMREMPHLKDIEIAARPHHEDIRSYQISSEKIKRELGFVPKRTVEQAILDMLAAFRNGRIPDPLTNPRYHNVEMMKEVMTKRREIYA